MITHWLVFLLAITLGFCADHDTFKNCSRVPFCSYLRQKPVVDKYDIDPTSLQLNENNDTISALLKPRTSGTALFFSLSALKNNTFRIQIYEANDFRYQIPIVLDGEPELIRFEDVTNLDGFNVTRVITESGSNVGLIYWEPFNLHFFKDNVPLISFNGNRLSLQRNCNNAPFGFEVQYPSANQLYGLHEHCDSLALQDTQPGGLDPYRLKNSDVGGYEINSTMALYGAVPVLYGHGVNGTAGVFLHNAAEQWIDITNGESSSSHFMVETGSLDLFVFLGPKPIDVVRQYTVLTGTAHLPQLWALGYHQSRYSYDNQDDVINVTTNFDSHNFQLDAVWLDIDYTDNFKYFTWNPTRFSDPVGLQETLSSTNKTLVTIIDPHIKVEQGYNVYDKALADDLFVKNSDDTVFQGNCWPGTSSYMDFLNPAARDFYASMYSYENFPHTTPTLGGIWNDMNEPSVFDNSLEMTLPADSVHIDGVLHNQIHNIYGLLHTMATHQGLLQRDNRTVRPFILSRSHFAGSQRFAAIWTGDNQADWPYLRASYQQCLTANILGIVFCGADVGGFGNNPSDELFQRWYQAGAWLPFFRAHSAKDTDRREPYLKSDDVQRVVRNAIQLRYKHLPVWYTLFFEHTITGDPIIRPLFYQYPTDASVYKNDAEFLVGSDILVHPVAEPGVTSVQVYFPGEKDTLWYAIEGTEIYGSQVTADISVDIESIPVFYRSGSVIFRKETIRSNTAAMVEDGLTLYVALDANNTAYGRYYLDDNVSFNYTDNLQYGYISATFNGPKNISIADVDPKGSGYSGITIDNVVILNTVKLPKGNRPGVYKKLVYSKDSSGNLLSNIKISTNQLTVLNIQ